MEIEKEQKYINQIFKWTLLLKFFNSLWQISLGFLIFFDKDLKESIFTLTTNRLVKHPNSRVAPFIQHILPGITHNTEIFIAIYFLVQGVLKIFLIAGLLRKKMWVYPLSMYVFLAFTFYQIYRFTHTHSPFLILLSTLDIITILVIEHKYKHFSQTK